MPAHGSRAPDAAIDAPAVREVKGVHAGAIVFAGIALANGLNYLFHLVAGRALGPTRYGDLAALAALIGFFTLPLIGAQLATARYVAAFSVTRDERAIATFFSRALLVAVAGGGLIVAALVAFAAPLARALDIRSVMAVVVALLVIVPSLLSPICWGVAQGLQRFTLFAVSTAAGPLVRVVALVPAVAAGATVGSATGAMLAGAAAGLLVPLWSLRDRLGAFSSRLDPEVARDVRRYLVPVAVGVVALTSLSTSDVVVANVALSDADAGLYGGASLVGRVILYLPAAIVTVLLPKVSARATAGRSSADVVAKSMLVTGAFCAVAVAAYASVPRLVLFLAFGSEFEAASDWLWMFAVAMTGLSLLNVMLAYHLGEGQAIASWLLLAGAVAQGALFAVFHDTAEELLAVDIAVAVTLTAVQGVVVWRALARQAATRGRRAVG